VENNFFVLFVPSSLKLSCACDSNDITPLISIRLGHVFLEKSIDQVDGLSGALCDDGIAPVAAGSTPAVVHVVEALVIRFGSNFRVGFFQCFVEGEHVFLIHGRKVDDGGLELREVVSGQKGRMEEGCCRIFGPGGCSSNNFGSPAETKDTNMCCTVLGDVSSHNIKIGLDLFVGPVLSDPFHEDRETSLRGEVVRRPRVSPEEVREGDPEATLCQLVAELLGGVPEAKDVVDADEGVFGLFGTDEIDVQVADSLDTSDGLVVGFDGRKGAACSCE